MKINFLPVKINFPAGENKFSSEGTVVLFKIKRYKYGKRNNVAAGA